MTVNSTGDEFRFEVGGEGGDAMKRVLGCTIMAAMPEKSIEEALTSLINIFEDSFEPVFYALPQPPRTYRSTGRIVHTSERPELVIGE